MTPEVERGINDFREILGSYEKAISEAGGKVEYSDFGLSMTAEHEGDRIWICQVFRVDRDGCYGYRMLGRPMVEAWLCRGKKEVEKDNLKYSEV